MNQANDTRCVYVVGSANQDLVMQVVELPAAGQTVLAVSSTRTAGGKGANQAVAARSAGAPTRFIGVVGTDDAGAFLSDHLEAVGVDVLGLRRDDRVSTGTAVVMVSDEGENAIVVLAGANGTLTADIVRQELSGIGPGDVLLVQCEIPRSGVEAAIRHGAERGAVVLLNWAPHVPLDRETPSLVTVLVVNESEASAALADLDDGLPLDAPLPQDGADVSAERLARALGTDVIITRGSAGSELFSSRDGHHRIPALPVRHVVDTTGAGDAYAGALAAALAVGVALPVAMHAATAAAARAVQHPGAQAPAVLGDSLAVPSP